MTKITMKPLKVKELIAVLMTMNQEALVSISKDSEGNEFSLMANQQSISGEVFLEDKLGTQDTFFTAEEVVALRKTGLVECILLWPTN